VEGIALHGDPSVRPYAVRLLVLGRDGRVFAALVELAANDALGVKELVALRAWGERAADALLEQWRASQGRARAAALELAAYVALGEPGQARVSLDLHGKVRAALREDVAASDPEVRLGAARAMLDWAEASDAHGLTEVAKRGPEEVSRAAGQALEALADRHQSAVRQSLAPVRLSGPGGAALTSVVARLAEDNVIDRLRDALSADDPVTRRSAVEALGTVGGADAADAIGIALADEDPDVQATAARVLGGLRGKAGAPVGVDRLLGAAAATNASVRAAVARALGDTRDARVFGALAALLDDEDPAVLIATMEGLRAYGDSAAGALVGRFLASNDQEMVKQALWCLAELDPAAARSALITALDHGAWDVRQLAAMLLGESRDPGAIAALTGRLASEDYDLVREAILSALAVVQGNG
jgi:HEAT repeat protein